MQTQHRPNLYPEPQALAACTQRALVQGDMVQVRKHLDIAEWQLTPSISAIARVPLYFLSNFAKLHRSQILPPYLEAKYLKQLNTSRI